MSVEGRVRLYEQSGKDHKEITLPPGDYHLVWTDHGWMWRNETSVMRAYLNPIVAVDPAYVGEKSETNDPMTFGDYLKSLKATDPDYMGEETEMNTSRINYTYSSTNKYIRLDSRLAGSGVDITVGGTGRYDAFITLEEHVLKDIVRHICAKKGWSVKTSSAGYVAEVEEVK